MNRESYAFSSLFFRKNNRNTSYYLFFFLFLSSFLFSQASFPYYENFEGSGNNGWTMVNGTQPNKWYVGSGTNNGGSRALYISNDGGSSFNYTKNTASTTHAYRDISIPTGTTNAYITFDWKANGEGSSPKYDYLQVWLVPSTYTPAAGTLITAGAGRVQLGTNLNLQNSFSFSSNLSNISAFAGANMRVVFSWRNNNSWGNEDPAAIDNFSVTKYCVPKFSNTNKTALYIDSFQFVGVLNTTVANPSTSAMGYQDFTSFTPIAEQPQGTAINIIASSASTNTPRTNGTWKAWVDWNNNGDFTDPGEEVYNMISFTTPSVTFGFIIPAGQAVGNYRLRIGTFSDDKFNFSSCSTASGFGEMEDYTFKVVADCSAKVNSVNTVNAFDGERCGPGSVRISATGNASAVDYRWYDSIYGGTLLGTGNTFNTPNISATTTYYVTAVSSGGCETPFRYPVEARIDPNPTVTFSTSDPAICGEDKPSLLVTASGDKYQDVIFEKFDAGLGVFINEISGAYTNSLGFWQRRDTPYIPTIAEGYEGLSPAMASGYFGAGFAMINTDISRGSSGQSILNRMVSNNLDVNGFLNLKVDFDLYNFTIAHDFTEGYTLIEYSLDGGTNWATLDQFIGTRGNPLKWEKFSYTIPGANFTSTILK